MQSKALKVGWVLMLILGIYRVVVSIILVATDVVDIANGLTLAATAAAIIWISLGSYRKAERWSWWCLLVVGILPLLGCGLVPQMDTPTLVGCIIGWVLFFLALVIPTYINRLSSSIASSSSKLRNPGKRPSSSPVINTTGNSRPLAQ